ncbi:MAG TPA: 23S rRNA (pseudouridine(1915)-N(3))-methyltransferase RlmH [Alphaproteobacteria bacterium]|nr:23S rRNA (pseudouridine(1915)-N(3))-methyltransferase RlmH [Alphaproteobacteria bacterium]
MKIQLLAIGKLRGPEAEWCDEYLKRLKGSVTIKDMSAPKSLPPAATQKAEADWLLKSISSKSFTVLLDERGKDLTSRELAGKMAAWQEQGRDLTFIIGGADGVTDDVKQHADFTLGFGKLTWPHRLVRVMLLEQLYRAQQINAGHPYHRD